MAADRHSNVGKKVSNRNSNVTINGQEYKFWDPLTITLGLPDIVTPVLGFNTSLQLLLFSRVMTQWYHILCGLVGGLGIVASTFFLIRTVYHMVTNTNTGKVATIVPV